MYVALLSVAAAYFLAWPIWRAQFLMEIWFTESWNAFWQDAAAGWAPLYPSPESLIGNNYPPLSFYVVGLLGKVLHVDSLYVGRWLSLVGLGALAIEVFAAVRILTGGRLGAMVASLWYLAIMARNSTIYIGANDPQIAGLAIMGAGLIWFLRRNERGASPIPAVLLMVVGGFWKHNNIAVPLVSLAWLYAVRSKFALHAFRASAEAVLVGLAVCVLIFGSNFIPNLLAPRQYAWSNIMGNLGHLQWCALALLIWAAWAMFDRKSRPAQFTALHIGVALAACIVQWLGHGIFGNAEFDLIFALAIGLGATFNRVGEGWLAMRIGANRCRDAMVAALLLRLVLSDRQETALLLLSSEFRQSLYDSERDLLSEASSVAAMPGDVACFVKMVCRQAGKPFVLDEFKTDELVAMGKATPAEVKAMLDDRDIRWISWRPNWADTSISRWLSSRNLQP
ncbi:hypothetical protein [Bradyrhizobium sp. LB11.1]|uniref:hypothetical protein n=1 Tax=Bradyrhizobium sp. LB11.1 TaxID=3156326 RepID=UPI003393BBF2